ncbi:MAG: general secretion pathway protein GspB [Gammaproteobacteria bacterium]|nr:general secretion pathway protein GspB [Gammaproteobacteria bacterium]MCZ6585350.1 general secretion pathway protein GspB [Gammaproteobacteria bacterium]
MSFILDALRKSESERQQSVVPGISDVPAVVHSTRIPKWTAGVIATLSAVVLVLGWAWWHSTDSGEAEVADIRPNAQLPRTQAVAAAARSGVVRDLAREPLSEVTSRPASASLLTQPVRESTSPTMVIGPWTIAELRATGMVLPDLTLELLVYSATASERFVRINSASYREGEVLSEGPRVLTITAEGVILDYRDRSFLLAPD